MVLVTGGSGFIGSVLARTLAERGERVRVFDVIDFPDRHPDVEFVQGDIRDADAITQSLRGIDTVYHNVALVPLAKAGRGFWDVNVRGTALLLDACRRADVERFVHTSSSAIFGVPRCPITRATPPRPVEVYGRAKLAGERLVETYIREGRTATIIRPRTVLGNFRLGIFDILFEWVSEHRTIFILGRGDNRFQFIHVDDLVDAMIRSAALGRSGTFHIGTDRFGMLRDDLAAFIAAVGSRSQVRSLPATPAIAALHLLDWLRLSPLAPWHYRTYHKPFYFDIRDEMRELRWQPRYSNVEMLTASYRWYLANRHVRRPATGVASVHHASPKQRVLALLKRCS
jgi:nucleoside-diphosphate-sugar epimerase